MNYNNASVVKLSGAMTIFAITLLVGIQINHAIAETGNYEYKMAEGVEAVTTFTFREGIETVSFPVFSMGENFVDNVGTSFQLQGVVQESPYLHKALDEAYKYRVMKDSGASFEFPSRYFDVQVEITKDGEQLRTLNYRDCEISDSKVETLNDDYESYGKTGFAIIETIDFRCGGLNFAKQGNFIPTNSSLSNKPVADYGKKTFEFAENAHTFLTFEFDSGIEKIEFPIFELTNGFKEDSDSTPAFKVTGLVGSYPLLHDAVDKARKVSNTFATYNQDFEVIAEFTNEGKEVRGLDYRDCRVTDYKIETLKDKEEGFTGKRGFAVVEEYGFQCSGMKPMNPAYNELNLGTTTNPNYVVSKHITNPYNMGTGSHAVATFTYKNGMETIDFPKFKQTSLYSRANPAFEVADVPGAYPLLYDIVDRTKKSGQKTSGVSTNVELFDVDIEMKYGDTTVRGYQYSKCRVTDYVISTQHDGEESFFKQFSLENVFDFECQGYSPYNPIYEQMFVTPKAKTDSTNNLKDTSDWDPGFKVN